MPSTLKQEIGLNRDFVSPDEEVLLALVATYQRLERLGYAFFARHGLTDAQFNALMILWDYREKPLTQSDLARLLLVNRASAGTMVARMAARRLVSQQDSPRDRRANRLHLTLQGERLLKRLKAPYYRLLAQVFSGMKKADKQSLIAGLEALRGSLRNPSSRGKDSA